MLASEVPEPRQESHFTHEDLVTEYGQLTPDETKRFQRLFDGMNERDRLGGRYADLPEKNRLGNFDRAMKQIVAERHVPALRSAVERQARKETMQSKEGALRIFRDLPPNERMRVLGEFNRLNEETRTESGAILPAERDANFIRAMQASDYRREKDSFREPRPGEEISTGL